jgi:hypothetical protein
VLNGANEIGLAFLYSASSHTQPQKWGEDEWEQIERHTCSTNGSGRTKKYIKIVAASGTSKMGVDENNWMLKMTFSRQDAPWKAAAFLVDPCDGWRTAGRSIMASIQKFGPWILEGIKEEVGQRSAAGGFGLQIWPSDDDDAKFVRKNDQKVG